MLFSAGQSTFRDAVRKVRVIIRSAGGGGGGRLRTIDDRHRLRNRLQHRRRRRITVAAVLSPLHRILHSDVPSRVVRAYYYNSTRCEIKNRTHRTHISSSRRSLCAVVMATRHWTSLLSVPWGLCARLKPNVSTFTLSVSACLM